MGLGWWRAVVFGLSKLLVLLINLKRKVGRHLETAQEVADAKIQRKMFFCNVFFYFGFAVQGRAGPRAVVTNKDKQFPLISLQGLGFRVLLQTPALYLAHQAAQ